MSKIVLQTQLERRRDALQGYIDFGVPLPTGVIAPRSMTMLRSWEVAELGIERIGSKSSTNPTGHTEEVKRLLGELVALVGRCDYLASTKARPPKVKASDRVSTLVREARENKVRLDELSNQLHQVEHERDQLKLSHATLSKALRDSKDELSDVRRQLNRLTTPGTRPNLTLADKGK
jgi:hypothetical protein